MSNAIEGDYPTDVLVIAARILRAISPETLGSILLVYSGTTDSQKEIADTIHRDQSTVSSYFQTLSLEKSPVSLVVKPGLHHTVTSTGEEVISLIDDMIRNLGEEIDSIDWGSESDKERIGELLSPLYESRSDTPFFLLNSLGNRSDLAHIDDTPSPVWLDEVVHDVEMRLQDIGEETSKKQIRQVADRFVESGAVSFDKTHDQLTLTEKGKEHAYLLDQLAEFVNGQVKSDVGNGKYTVGSTETEATVGDQDAFAGETTSNDSTHQMTMPGSSAQQLLSQQSQEIQQLSPDLNLGNATVMTVYCLRLSDESAGESTPILPLTEMTVGDLVEKGNQIAQKYGKDAELVPYRMVRVNEELYPLTPIESHSDDSS
ncbi:hypothetical protein [Haladaptatus halobius]|uniref:hypothetical protein n=1 Tax=Haladaptatus halobius TaxID=2884875 RepID=UPI001D0AB6F2|nr:hypothetical protein [Haladaptatus halobius]